MKSFLYVTLFLVSSLNAQLLTENFNDFLKTIPSAESYYWTTNSNDSSKFNMDLTGSEDTLWWNTSYDHFSSPGTSVLVNGINIANFDGSNEQILKDTNYVAVPGNDYSYTLIFSPSTLTQTVPTYLFEYQTNNPGVVVDHADFPDSLSFYDTDNVALQYDWQVPLILDPSYLALTYDGANFKVYYNGVLDTTIATVYTSTPGTDDIALGGAYPGSNGFKGSIEFFSFHSEGISEKQVVELAYLADGWAVTGSDVSGVTRSSFAFHQGIVADTVYYNTALTSGSWSITANVDGAAGGESLLVLTSADASTWTTIGTMSATTTATNYTVTGNGLGYIGFGLASGTVYIDNVIVSLAGNDPGFDGWKKWNRFKGFK